MEDKISACSNPSPTEASELIALQRSFFGNVTLEVKRNRESEYQVWIRTREKSQGAILLSTTAIVKSVAVSDDETCIVVDIGNASSGRYPMVFLRGEAGDYEAKDDNISLKSWLAVKQELRLPEDAQPSHLYCRTIFVRSKPLQIVMLLPGNYVSAGKRQKLALKRLTYAVREGRVTDIEDDIQWSETE